MTNCAPWRPRRWDRSSRVYERWKAEHGYDGGYSLAKDFVRDLKLSRREVFLRLQHEPDEAQVDFGYCPVDIAG